MLQAASESRARPTVSRPVPRRPEPRRARRTGVGLLGLLGLAAAVGLLAAGCTAPGGRPPEDGVPADLELEVLLMEGRGRRLARTVAGEDDPRIPAGRWIVLGDGSLHHLARPERDATETGVHPSRRPAPRIRTLTAGETADLWTLVVSTGLADSDVAGPPLAPVTVSPDFDETVFVLAARAGGRRWSVVRRELGPMEELDPAAAALLDRLAALTWLGDPPGGRLVPRRYDLGDDPWARHRDPDASGAGGPERDPASESRR